MTINLFKYFLKTNEVLRSNSTRERVLSFYGEFHSWSPTGYTKEQRDQLNKALKATGTKHIDWAGEQRSFADFETLTKLKIPPDTPGSLDGVHDKCNTVGDEKKLAIIIEVGMNAKTARRLIGTITAYSKPIPLTMFLYGDFVQQNPDLVKEWSQRYDIEVRAGKHWPLEYWQLQNKNTLRMDIVSALVKFQEVGLSPAYILPSSVNNDVADVIKKRNLRTINSTITFPPRTGDKMTQSSYFRFRDVERIPKALNLIHSSLNDIGGILSLDTDFPDSHMISVFLLDYLFEVSPYHIVSLRDCLK
ncbi:uncharacterized protein LOC144444861 [Glandiceps talaboti]